MIIEWWLYGECDRIRPSLGDWERKGTHLLLGLQSVLLHREAQLAHRPVQLRRVGLRDQRQPERRLRAARHLGFGRIFASHILLLNLLVHLV